MCLDISFKIDETEDSLFDYLPNLKIDPQLDINFENNSHMCAMDRPKTKVIYINEQGDPYLTLMRWGILMQYMFKDEATFKKYAYSNFNARAEHIFDESSTWYKIIAQRCLIDTDGIYEHREIIGWKDMIPHFIQLANGKRLLIPALYFYPEISREDVQRVIAINSKPMIQALNKIIDFIQGNITPTVAMITRRANQLFCYIHNHGLNKHRMPLLMQPEQAIEWIDPDLSFDGMKAMLDYEIPSEELKYRTVYTIRTNRRRPDGKQKHEYFNWHEPPLGIDRPIVPELF